MHPTTWLKLAALLDSIKRSHPLLDDNERLVYLTVALVLRGNRVDESHMSNEGRHDLIVRAASGRVELEELAAELQEMIERSGRGTST